MLSERIKTLRKKKGMSQEELAGMCEQERLEKQANRIRGKILFLVIISLIFISVIKNELTQILAVGVCTLTALWILYKNLAPLTIVTTKNLKLKALRQATIFNMVVIGLCIVGAILTGTGMVKIGPTGEKYFAALTVGAVLMCVAVSGIISALFYYRKFHIKSW